MNSEQTAVIEAEVIPTKPKRKRKVDGRKGKPSQLRPISKDATTSNQHISSPQQDAFIDAYMMIDSPTFGNAYQSALAVGYSENYARTITAPATGNEWIKDNSRLRSLEDKHINLLVEAIATDKGNRTADRLKALELSARLKGLLIERKHEVKEVITIDLGTL